MANDKRQSITSDLADRFFDQFIRQGRAEQPPPSVPAGEGKLHRAHPKKKARRKLAKESRRRNR